MSRDLPEHIEYSVQRLADEVGRVADELHTANLMGMLTLHDTSEDGVLEWGERKTLVADIRTRLGLDS